MALIDTYKNNKRRIEQDIYRLRERTAKEEVNIANANKRIMTARESINRNNSKSIIESKYREITRYEKSIIDIGKKIATNNLLIARKMKDLYNEQSKIEKEVAKINKRSC